MLPYVSHTRTNDKISRKDVKRIQATILIWDWGVFAVEARLKG